MKKTLVISFAVILLAVIVAVAYWLISPLWRTVRVSESVPVRTQSLVPMEVPVSTQQSVTVAVQSPVQNTAQNPVVRTIAQGTFTGFDRLHTGSGTASIIEVDGSYYVRFESDFKVTNGPDLYVGFGKDQVYVTGSELGTLKGTEGSQNYKLDATIVQKIQQGDYTDVWVWCKAFAVPFARADFEIL